MEPACSLRCLTCHAEHEPRVRQLHCPSCGGLFTIVYSERPSGENPRLPLAAEQARVSLGEGSTPTVSLAGLASRLGLANLWAKLEFMAPTGSFKDRGSAILVSAAVTDRVSEFVEDSSGNAGASLSAYAAAAGMKAHVFAPATASKGKLDQIRVFGAELHVVDGSRQAATDAAQEFVRATGLPYLSHNHSPFFAEGMKSVAHELVRSQIDVSDVVLPVGNGSLLIGMKRGFDELVEAGAIGNPPAFHVVQSQSVMPVVAAINGLEWDAGKAPTSTRASGIAVSKPPRLAEILAAVHGSAGSGVAVSEDSLLEWQESLARETGIFCEPTSAVAFAGLEQLLLRGTIRRGATVVIPVTGSGLKEPI